jgi:mycothiol synthase
LFDGIAMNNSINDSLVVMRRADLIDLPEVNLAQGFEIRTFREEDEWAWERVVCEAFEKDKSEREGFFNRRMREDAEFYDPGCILMVWKDDLPVATASAWFRNQYGIETGYLHKVAVIESERGKGLGYQASLACLHKMAADGRSRAVLRTQVRRIPAILTYLKLKFKPMIADEDDFMSWEAVGRLIIRGVQ